MRSLFVALAVALFLLLFVEDSSSCPAVSSSRSRTSSSRRRPRPSPRRRRRRRRRRSARRASRNRPRPSRPLPRRPRPTVKPARKASDAKPARTTSNKGRSSKGRRRPRATPKPQTQIAGLQLGCGPIKDWSCSVYLTANPGLAQRFKTNCKDACAHFLSNGAAAGLHYKYPWRVPKVCPKAKGADSAPRPRWCGQPQVRQCRIAGDPHVWAWGAKRHSEAMPLGVSWLAKIRESWGDLWIQSQHCPWKLNGQWASVACGLAVNLPQGGWISVQGENKISHNCGATTAAKLNAIPGVSLRGQDLTLCLGGTTVQVRMGKVYNINIWTKECQGRAAEGWCAAAYDRKYYSVSQSASAPNPAKVPADNNAFRCAGIPARGNLPPPKVKGLPVRAASKPKSCPKHLMKRAQALCRSKFRKYDNKLCPLGTFARGCLADVCMNWSNRNTLADKAIKDYLDTYNRRGVHCLPCHKRCSRTPACVMDPLTGKKYYNKCYARCAGVLRWSSCLIAPKKKPPPKKCKCPKAKRCVLDYNTGVRYLNSCWARCAGVKRFVSCNPPVFTPKPTAAPTPDPKKIAEAKIKKMNQLETLRKEAVEINAEMDIINSVTQTPSPKPDNKDKDDRCPPQTLRACAPRCLLLCRPHFNFDVRSRDGLSNQHMRIAIESLILPICPYEKDQPMPLPGLYLYKKRGLSVNPPKCSRPAQVWSMLKKSGSTVPQGSSDSLASCLYKCTRGCASDVNLVVPDMKFEE